MKKIYYPSGATVFTTQWNKKQIFIIKLKPWLIENISTITLIYLASPLLPRCVQVQYIGVGLTWLGLCVWRLLAGMEGCCGVQPRWRRRQLRHHHHHSSPQCVTGHRALPTAHTSSTCSTCSYSDISVACECYFCVLYVQTNLTKLS